MIGEKTEEEKKGSKVEKTEEEEKSSLGSPVRKDDLILNLEEKITRFETEMMSLEGKGTKLEEENKRLKDAKEIDVGMNEQGGFWSLISEDSQANKCDKMTYTCIQCSDEFFNENDFVNHEKVHSQEDVQSDEMNYCEFCGDSFSKEYMEDIFLLN